jgi:hypothetical protein
MGKQFDIPILYTVFNRLDLVKKTFPEIKRIKPLQLFIGADGPRTKGEKKKTDEVRKYIIDNLNWKCEVKTLFLEKNLGVHKATFKEIDWFFNNVEKGIILEDDDLPNKSFFKFCREMLIKYEKDKRIFSISGFTSLKKIRIRESYYFSKNFGVWGWATWKDRWKNSNLLKSDYELYKKNKKLNKIIQNPIERAVLRKRFDYYLIGGVRDWAFSFLFIHYKKNGICIKPKINLIKNLGFGKEFTNTYPNIIDRKFLCIENQELDFPLVSPIKIEPNKELCKKEFELDLLRIFLKNFFKKLHFLIISPIINQIKNFSCKKRRGDSS